MALTDEAPKYERPMQPPDRGTLDTPRRGNDRKPRTEDPTEALKLLLSSLNICSKRWVYEQYDTMVRTNTVVMPGSDAAVIRVKETRRAIAMCLDGSGKFVAIDPREGARLAVAEAARNVVCVGARPIAVTNCLNFASPERPEVMWAFSEVIDGIKEACEEFETPVVSGNVSFYKETDGRGILPTPTIGMVGLIEDTRKIITHGFKKEGDLIAVLGATHDDLAASEYSQIILGLSTNELIANGDLPHVDLAQEKLVQEALLKLADEMLISSAHDCSDGGLAVAIAESCFSSLGRHVVGAEIEIDDPNISNESLLFGESPSRIVISFSAGNLENVKTIIGDCPFKLLGRVAGSTLNLSSNGKSTISVSIDDLEVDWRDSLKTRLEN